jgi:hypothetical protein
VRLGGARRLLVQLQSAHAKFEKLNPIAGSADLRLARVASSRSRSRSSLVAAVARSSCTSSGIFSRSARSRCARRCRSAWLRRLPRQPVRDARVDRRRRRAVSVLAAPPPVEDDKQETKDEQKETEGRPEVRSRLRQLQRAIAQRE